MPPGRRSACKCCAPAQTTARSHCRRPRGIVRTSVNINAIRAATDVPRVGVLERLNSERADTYSARAWRVCFRHGHCCQCCLRKRVRGQSVTVSGDPQRIGVALANAQP
jgi:hypothetical protein